jgi:hypothetical protein
MVRINLLSLKKVFRPTLLKIILTIILGGYFVFAMSYVMIESPSHGASNSHLPLYISAPLFLFILPFVFFVNLISLGQMIVLILWVLYVYLIACIISLIITIIIKKTRTN